MILTPAGQDVYYYARSIVDQADTLSKLHTDASTPIQKNLRFAIAVHFSPEDPLFHETTIDPQRLSGYRLVRTPPDYFGYLSWGHLIEQYSFPRFNQTLTISQYHTIVRFLRTPGNILIGHTLQAQEFEKAGIQTRPIRGSQGQLTLSSVHHNHNQHTIPPEAKVLRAAVLNYYQQLP
ncbi:LysR substrate binding domain-containing protein [Eubacterium aggregans]|uniref:LysR substrate binding domain-containing protein n=1 Tax=Eubacterium aggregans TaxID=81409 RepID=A0A1H4CRP7_9FIRM|nr:hypothetical protein [Eubacterium aggregans]SEA63035.1 LysR substrate binding domain-containing protein [Eubacterium aggregans]